MAEETASPLLDNADSQPNTGRKYAQMAFLWIGLLLLVKFAFMPLAEYLLGGSICNLQASHCAYLCQLLGIEAIAEGNRVLVSHFTLLIWFDCTGLDYMLYLAGLVALFPVAIKRRWLWCIVLPLGFYILQLVRLVVLLYSGANWPEGMHFLHRTWSIGFILCFCLVWTLFLTRQLRPSPAAIQASA
jgi:exosortase/archaeosortase family protein